jgi:phytoene dehydrogenase-like protein
MYASPAPAFDQLELWKYGFRMKWNPVGWEDLMKGGNPTTQGVSPNSEKDIMGFAKMGGMLGQPKPFTKELMRATFWCPPHPPEIEVTDENVPYMQVYKKYQPDVVTSELRQWTMFDMMDEHFGTEPFKVVMAFAALGSGAAGHWEGMAVPALLAVQLLVLPNLGRQSVPRGGLHGYFHSVHRCAVAHGAVVRTMCAVEEIIIEDGRAVGVRLREDAAMGGKKIWANKAVIAAVDYRQTFFEMVGRKHLEPNFIRSLEDVSLKGGTLYVSTFHTKEPIRWKSKWSMLEQQCPGPDRVPFGLVYPSDSRELYYENVADCDARKSMTTLLPERRMWLQCPSQNFDPTDCQGSYPNGYISAPFETNVSIPELQVEGIDTQLERKGELDEHMRKAFSQALDGFEPENILHTWSSSGREVEFRNTGLIGGAWGGSRHCNDQSAGSRPIPELTRYRSPIDGLYCCHQTMSHPGGLCLMAIPYNLMHILIEDGVVEPGRWWYPSPYYIPQDGKISAIPG